ncbi:MAG: hypothetical protein HYU49_00290 [Candidatus Levybacteria bacterium]|nr:hypothetical protein [Candidatus Levybacteria bacterium]
MTKKQLKDLALQSYTKDLLDQKKVESVARLLTRFQLKQYIRELRNSESQKTINIVLPHLPAKTDQQMLSRLFAGKRIIYHVDKTLLLGIKIIDNDQVYDLNLKDTLDNLFTFVSSGYD